MTHLPGLLKRVAGSSELQTSFPVPICQHIVLPAPSTLCCSACTAVAIVIKRAADVYSELGNPRGRCVGRGAEGAGGGEEE